MITKKLKNFEYAGLKTTLEVAPPANNGEVDAFETPNGHTLISAVAKKQVDENKSTTKIICERIKYYLDNEVLENPAEALFNALVYTNGFVYELKRKNEVTGNVVASVACILVKDSRVYYAWMGESSFFLFNGKRVYPLGWALVQKDDEEVVSENFKSKFIYLGDQQFAEPAVCEQPLVPVDNDIFVMGAGKPLEMIKPKIYNSILADSMPTFTKAQRLVGIASDAFAENIVALQVLSFYNLENQQLSVFPPIKEPEPEPEAEPDLFKENEKEPQSKKTLKKTLIIAACLLAVAYMFFDLFLKDPVSVVNVQSGQTEEVEGANASVEAAVAAALLADVTYTVKSGDTWARIYSEFEVCSWFIKNHPPNSGKFDNNENPVADRTLAIPVKYSGKKELNPKYFTEFSLDKLGRTCQNANEEFRKSFEAKAN